VIFTASTAHLQTNFETTIVARSPNHDSGAGRPIFIEHNTESREQVMNHIISAINELAVNSLNFPEIRFSTNGGPILINFVFLPDRHMDVSALNLCF
jgi:hypothetical protein